jgi:predicted porin
MQVGTAGWAFGAHYAENDNGLTAGTLDEEGWGVGASYDMPGPWSFGIEYFYGEASHGAGNGKDEYEALKLAANRNLGPGVNWAISLIQTEVDAADAATGGLLGGVAGTDVKGTTLATSLSLSF